MGSAVCKHRYTSCQQ